MGIKAISIHEQVCTFIMFVCLIQVVENTKRLTGRVQQIALQLEKLRGDRSKNNA